MDCKNLETAYEKELLRIYEQIKKETGYSARRFLISCRKNGGLQTVKKILHKEDSIDGLKKLEKHTRMDLSIEATVLNQKWNGLFSDHEREISKNRLESLGYVITYVGNVITFDTLENRFHDRVIKAYKEIKDEVGSSSKGFLRSLSTVGAVKACKNFLTSKTIGNGFIELQENGRLDLSVEAIVLEPKWSKLFTENELEIARKRLDECGYNYGMKIAA